MSSKQQDSRIGTKMKISKALDKKRKTVKGGPRRPLTAYNLFFQIGRQRLVNGDSVDDISVEDINKMTIHQQARHKLRTTHQRTHGKIGFQELAKTLGKKWKSLDPICKRRLDELATTEKKRYAAEMEIWKKSQEAQSTQKAKHTNIDRPPDVKLQAKNMSVKSSKPTSSATKKMPHFSLMQHPLDSPAGHHDQQRNGMSSADGYHRTVPPHMEPHPAFHPSNMQNDHFQQYNSHLASSYHAPTTVWQGSVANMHTTPPFGVVSGEPFNTISPRKVSLSSCHPMERSLSYDDIEPVHIKEWTHPPRNVYEDYHRYPAARHLEQHAHLSYEETNTVHSLTNIDMDFLSVHCEDGDDISVLGM